MLIRNLWILVFVLGINIPGMAQSKFTLSGKLRLLESVEIKIESIIGEKILSAWLTSGEDFKLGPEWIEPDIYILYIGDTRQALYLTNNEVTIKGFYDARNPKNSALTFTGIDEFLKLSKWIPTEAVPSKRTITAAVKGALTGNMYSALAYLSNMTQYEPNKMLLDLVPEDKRGTASAQWLSKRVDSLGQFAVGAQAYNFEYVNPDGGKVRLSDFRGKIVLVDFWASWCGPCRQEMKSLLPIYNELKGDDLEFISISLDKREQDWRRMLKDENLPWVMLWNKEGFTIGNEPNQIQKAYGFYGIPFIVLIDKEGKIIARGLRGEKVKEAILKARQGI